MKKIHWTKKKIERYCKMILGIVPWIDILSRKELDGFAAIAYSLDPQGIDFAIRDFPRELIWHECGHLMGFGVGFRNWYWTSERDAQLNAIRRALDMGFFNVARELVEDLDNWKVLGGVDYPRARIAVLKELGL